MRPEKELAPHHVVASYDAYPKAVQAVDSLARDGYPVDRLTILAGDLRLVENVTGQVGYGRAAIDGAVSGGPLGAIVGFFLGLLSVIDPLVSAFALSLYGFVLGAAVGVLFGVIAHAVSGRRRSFSSSRSLAARRYDVVTDTVDDARRAGEMLSPPT